MLNQIKLRCGIPLQVTVYDEPEIRPLIADALADMESAGVPSTILHDKGAETDPRVLTAVTLYVQAHRGSDRTDTARYLELYHAKVFKLSLEPVQQEAE